METCDGRKDEGSQRVNEDKCVRACVCVRVCVCVCLCVNLSLCVREREREREKKGAACLFMHNLLCSHLCMSDAI